MRPPRSGGAGQADIVPSGSVWNQPFSWLAEQDELCYFNRVSPGYSRPCATPSCRVATIEYGRRSAPRLHRQRDVRAHVPPAYAGVGHLQTMTRRQPRPHYQTWDRKTPSTTTPADFAPRVFPRAGAAGRSLAGCVIARRFPRARCDGGQAAVRDCTRTHLEFRSSSRCLEHGPDRGPDATLHRIVRILAGTSPRGLDGLMSTGPRRRNDIAIAGLARTARR